LLTHFLLGSEQPSYQPARRKSWGDLNSSKNLQINGPDLQMEDLSFLDTSDFSFLQGLLICLEDVPNFSFG